MNGSHAEPLPTSCLAVGTADLLHLSIAAVLIAVIAGAVGVALLKLLADRPIGVLLAVVVAVTVVASLSVMRRHRHPHAQQRHRP